MPLTFNIPAGGDLFFQGDGSGSTLQIPTETELRIFRKASVVKPAISQNFLGMYTLINAGRDGKVRFGNFTPPKAVLKKRRFGCVWDPNTCGVKFESEEIDTCPLEYQQELCADVAWDSCWEKLMGIGNDVHNLEATSEGSALLSTLLEQIHIGIGNSYYDVVTFGAHPLIEMANTNGWYATVGKGAEDWKCFYDQMKDCGGLLTTVDALKAAGETNFNVEILAADISGKKYIGDTFELFERLIDGMPSEMQLLANRQFNGQMIVGVTRGIFNKYKKDLIAAYGNIPHSYYLQIKGEANGCDDCADINAPGVLFYDNMWIVAMDEWSSLDAWIGTTSHRAILMTPGIFGLAYDVNPEGQFSGMGMQIDRWTKQPHAGKTFFWANFKVGTAILDKGLMVSAELTLNPA